MGQTAYVPSSKSGENYEGVITVNKPSNRETKQPKLVSHTHPENFIAKQAVNVPISEPLQEFFKLLEDELSQDASKIYANQGEINAKAKLINDSIRRIEHKLFEKCNLVALTLAKFKTQKGTSDCFNKSLQDCLQDSETLSKSLTSISCRDPASS